MYAIIETGGKQYWVTQGEVLKVEKLSAESGQTITLKALWAGADSADRSASASPGATVTAEVLGEIRARKILVFKKRTKKAYKKLQGHRQYLTRIQIKSISPN